MKATSWIQRLTAHGSLVASLGLVAALSTSAAACVTSVTQMQTARTLAPGETRVHVGSSIPIASRYFSEIIDSLDLIAARLENAESAGEPISEEEQRQAVEGAAAVLLLQPSFVPELGLRVGIVEHFDVGLRYSGPAFRFDAKVEVAEDPEQGQLAIIAGYNHHTGIGASIATSAFDLFDSLNLASFSRRDLEFALIANTPDDRGPVSYYGGVRYILAMPRIDSALAEGIEAESGMPLIELDTNMHHLGATAGVRLRWRSISLMAEMTAMYMTFSPTILGEVRDLGGVLISPGLGLAVEI